MSIVKDKKLSKLQCTFPKLTEANQHYILGIAAGLKYMQEKIPKVRRREKQAKPLLRSLNVFHKIIR